jgi:hypothetical protein
MLPPYGARSPVKGKTVPIFNVKEQPALGAAPAVIRCGDRGERHKRERGGRPLDLGRPGHLTPPSEDCGSPAARVSVLQL